MPVPDDDPIWMAERIFTKPFLRLSDLAVPHARPCGDGNSRVPNLSINAMQARQ
jgi:hypothetical protein